MATLRIALAQIGPVAGAVARNSALIQNAIMAATTGRADVLLTPEMAVSGYPAEDLLGEPSFLTDVEQAVTALAAAVPDDLLAVLGAPMRIQALPEAGGARLSGSTRLDSSHRTQRNVVALAHAGQVRAAISKVLLPEYSVFDDARWASPGVLGQSTAIVSGVRVGFAICEDIWPDEEDTRPDSDSPVADSVAASIAAQGAQVLLVSNASPFYAGKPAERERLVTRLAHRTGLTVVYLNAAGAQDELVFDGGSMAIAPSGEVLFRAPLFTTGTFIIDVEVPAQPIARQHGDLEFTTARLSGPRPPVEPLITEPMDEEEETYTALVHGLGDYVRNNGFQHVLLGLSGGLDSALAAAIAVDALGPDAVRGIGMPGPYSSTGSVTDAQALAVNLGIRFDVISIKETYEAELALLGEHLTGPGVAVAKENIQARLRALHLMTLANATGAMLINTGNRSEAAVGYFTLGGDSSGGYAPLKDIPKTLAYRLSEWRNSAAEKNGAVPPIPADTITKAPSAELAPDQVDSNSLPEYPVLDYILRRYLEDLASADEIVAGLITQGHAVAEAQATVLRVLTMTDRAEHKRRQVAPGLKVTRRAFGRDRRVPITNGRIHHVTDGALPR
jgi:NAD+ synthase (glutamine-hydrolysing)